MRVLISSAIYWYAHAEARSRRASMARGTIDELCQGFGEKVMKPFRRFFFHFKTGATAEAESWNTASDPVCHVGVYRSCPCSLPMTDESVTTARLFQLVIPAASLEWFLVRSHRFKAGQPLFWKRSLWQLSSSHARLLGFISALTLTRPLPNKLMRTWLLRWLRAHLPQLHNFHTACSMPRFSHITVVAHGQRVLRVT